jgi:hypothetical protein
LSELVSDSRAKVYFSLGALILVGIHADWPQTLDQIGLLLLLIAILPWVIPYLRANFTSIEFGAAKLALVERKLEEQSQKLGEQSRRIDQLYIASMPDKVFQHIEKLADPAGYKNFYLGTGLRRELEYLENLGFIQFNEPLKGIDDFLDQFRDKEGDNLSKFIELTPAGKLFFKLREEARAGNHAN